MFINYNEEPTYSNEAYKTHILKLHPNILEEDFNEMFDNFKKEMIRQAGKRDASMRN